MFHSLDAKITSISVQEFESYTAAVSASGGTYDKAVIAQTAFENARSIRSQDDFQLGAGEGEHIFLAIPLAARNASDVIRILDFGGGAGVHAALSVRNFGNIEQKWGIVETVSVVEACSSFATDNIQFFTSIEDAMDWLGYADFVHCSGTLQYMPDPLASARELVSIGAPTLLIQRSALSLSRKLIELDTIPLGASALDDDGSGACHDAVAYVPVTYVDQGEFVSSLCDVYNMAYAFKGQPYKTVNDTEIEFGSAYLLQRN